MIINEVKTIKEIKEFIRFPLRLYANARFYVPPLSAHEFNALSPEKNPAYQYCDAKLWTVKERGEVVGRIAGIINKKENALDNNLVARFGWLDFKNDVKIAQLLFNTAENWAIENDAKIIHGPLGFTSFDKSGVLVDGFNELPPSLSNYNYDYYASVLEQLGYEKEFDWVEYRIKVPESVPEKLEKGANLIGEKFGLSLLPVKSISDLKKIKSNVFEILNESYAGLNGFTKLTESQFNDLFNQFSNVILPGFTAIVQNKDSEIIGFGVAIPSLSKAFVKMKGKLLPFGLWHLLKAKRKNDVADLLLIAIKPEYQKKGAHTLIFNKVINSFINNGIRYVETTKELEHNNHIQNLWQDYEYRQHRRSRCYVKQL